MGKAIISKVFPNSLAGELNLEPGDKILKLNQQEPEDLIDFQILWADEEITLLVEKNNNEQIIFEIEKEFDEGLGVEFENAVFDKIRRCHNKCLFCFVDQMGPAMRKSLYEKDDDYRLSFLQGNFITLTNLREDELARIKRLHLSPLYVSVHTTDPQLRVKILGNPQAAKIIEHLEDLIQAGIEIHTQIVLCPGINDDKYLDKTIADLRNYWPGIKSIAIVPVGVTKFRKDLDNFPHVSKAYAQQLIDKISKIQNKFKMELKKTLVYLADEFYIKAETDFPTSIEYDGFPQIENGIGLCRLFIDEFEKVKPNLPQKVSFRKYTVVTSVLGQYVLKPIIKELTNIKGLEIEVITVANYFFGPRVTVSGLLTGQDLLKALKDIEPNSKVIFPDIMLKNGEDIFLDGLKPTEIEKQLNITLIKVANSAEALIKKLLER